MTVTEQDPLLGATLVGRYRIDERIGAGAMGAVYRAEQVGLGRQVALKVLKKHAGASADVVARFEREAKAMSALTHPNTVRVYDFGATHEGLLFLAMELLEGEPATDRLTARQGLRASDAISWVRQVLRSIGEAHQKGIIHRDIKPDNIFLSRSPDETAPVVKVLDFGIAKAVGGEHKVDQFETQDGTVFGTPRYMSPEQAQGKALDVRSDLYAVGIVLFELLVGAPPFIDKDAVVVMAKHIREAPPTLQSAAPKRTFPQSLQRVLDKALSKRPAERFQTAEEFDAALAPCMREALLIERTPVRGRAVLAAVLSLPGWALFASAAVALGALSSTIIARSEPRAGKGPRAASTVAPASQPAVAAKAAGPTEAEPALVTVHSEPQGANVWTEGRFAGVAPLALAVPDGRSVRVQLSLPGYASRTVDLAPNEGSRVVPLDRAPAAIAPAGGAPAPVAAKAAPEEAAPTKPRVRAKRRGARVAAKAHDAYEKF